MAGVVSCGRWNVGCHQIVSADTVVGGWRRWAHGACLGWLWSLESVPLSLRMNGAKRHLSTPCMASAPGPGRPEQLSRLVLVP